MSYQNTVPLSYKKFMFFPTDVSFSTTYRGKGVWYVTEFYY